LFGDRGQNQRSGTASIVVCFPETASKAVAQIIERMQSVVRSRVTKPIEITAEIAEGDKAVLVLQARHAHTF
jgi:hypothetical protein